MQIVNYIGYTTPDSFFVHGRLLKNRPIQVSVQDGFFKNIWNTLRRALTRKVKHENIVVRYDDHQYAVVTDEEGYFRLKQNHPRRINDGELEDRWDIAYIIHPYAKKAAPLFPFKNKNPIGIISDIDDTILDTGAGGFLMLGLIWKSLTQNIFKRDQVDQMSSLYSGIHVYQKIPIVYLSNSPTNFNNMLRSFMDHNHFPSGPLFLRDYGLPTASQRKEMREHKSKTIAQLIQDNPRMQWICIGDDTSHDLKVYAQASKDHPHKVLSIHIRRTRDNNRTNQNEPDIHFWTTTQMLSDQLDKIIRAAKTID